MQVAIPKPGGCCLFRMSCWSGLYWAGSAACHCLGKTPTGIHTSLFYHSVHWWKLLWFRATERKDKDTGKNQSSETVSTASLGLPSIYLPLWGSVVSVCFLYIYLFIFGWSDCINRKTAGKLKIYFCIFNKLRYEWESLDLFVGVVCLFTSYVGDWDIRSVQHRPKICQDFVFFLCLILYFCVGLTVYFYLVISSSCLVS